MIDIVTFPDASTDSSSRILVVLDNVATRRLSGERVPDADVIAAFPDLMPDLGVHLQALHAAEHACQLATGSSGRSFGQDISGQLPGTDKTLSAAPGGLDLLEEIGRGAMGVVHRARQRSTGRDVAVKIMFDGPFTAAQDRARFEREAQLLGQFKHPNIVTVHDTRTIGGRFCIVMDYIAGETLDRYLAQRKPPLAECARLFAQICEAVGAAHVRGVIHRDLKPANIRVDASGTPHVLDFGLAKAAWDGAESAPFTHSVTMTGQFVGSLPWASPEQASGSPAQTDVRSDVYALGVMFFQIVTGEFPYPVTGPLRQVIDHITSTEPARPSTRRRDAGDELDTIILKCLAKEPERRYQSAGELARDLRHYLAGEPIEAKRDSGWYVLRKALRRNRTAMIISASFIVLLATFSVTMSVLYRRAQREAARATTTLAFLQDTLFQASSHRLGPEAKLVALIDLASARLQDAFFQQPEVAASLHYTLGFAYDTLWQQRKSAGHLRRALTLYEQSLGRDHPDSLRCKVLLGMVLAELREAEAVELQRDALARRLRILGAEHPLVAESKSELAYALWRVPAPRQWTEATQLYTEAIPLYQRTLGDEHPDLARCLHACAAMHHAMDRHADAERLYRESLAISRARLGPEHQFVAECMIDYSAALESLGRYEESDALLQEVLAVAPKLFGVRAVPGLMHRMASLNLARGDLPSAWSWINRAMVADLELLAQRQPDRAAIHEQLSEARGAAAQRPWPVRQYRSALRLLRELSDTRAQAGNAGIEIGRLFLAEQDGAESAVIVFAEAAALLEDAAIGNLAHIAYARSLYGQALAKAGRLAEAEPVLDAAHSALAGTLGARHPRTTRVADDLADIRATLQRAAP